MLPTFKTGDVVVWTPRNSYGIDFKGRSYLARITGVDSQGRYSVQRDLPSGDVHWASRDESELAPA